MKSGAPLRRTPMKKKPPRRGRMDPEFRAFIISRDEHRCQAARVGYHPEVACHGPLAVHHRVLGSKIDEEWNCVTLCLAHHTHAHDVDRAGAEECGLIIRHST